MYLGWTYLIAWIRQWSPDPQTLQRTFELEQKALTLDDTLPRAHIILSWVYMFQAKYEPAVTEAERAIALDPNDAESYVALANVFNMFGERTTEAIELLEKAIRLNPRYPFGLLISTRLGLQLSRTLRGGDRRPETSPFAQPLLAVFSW